LRLPGALSGGSMSVTVSTVWGWRLAHRGQPHVHLTQRSRASLSCVGDGDGGQIQLLQTGSGAPAPLVVRIRDSSGAVTQSVVVPS
jgi:hypothetical protein